MSTSSSMVNEAALIAAESEVSRGRGTLRELPDMMSASEGEGVSWKSRCSMGGCVNFVLQISGQGGGGKKSENSADIISGRSLRPRRRSRKGEREGGKGGRKVSREGRQIAHSILRLHPQ